MAFFRLPTFNLHHSKWSDWYMGSPSGEGGQFGTPEVRVGVDSQTIRIPMTEVRDGTITRSFILKGSGVGLGVGIGLSLPFFNYSSAPKNVPGTKVSLPGIGSRVRYSMFSPDPMEPYNFKGLCWIASVSGMMLGAQTSNLCVVFAAEASPLSLSPTSLNAAAMAAGAGFTTSLGGVSADAVVFSLHLG